MINQLPVAQFSTFAKKTTHKILGFATVAVICSPLAMAVEKDQSASYWMREGQQSLQQALALRPNTKKAKNVILFVGDGNGVTSVTATRIFDGQSKGMPGEENVLSYEHFPHVALSKTYNTNQQTPDSAGTMTAIMTGVKTKAGVISVGPETTLGKCSSGINPLPTLLEKAKSTGKATGVVTTARITHATPAATYAHAAHRGWEGDSKIPKAMKGCATDIALQLIEGGLVDVMMGGGRKYFMPEASKDPEYPEERGHRKDGRNLIAEWQSAHPTGQYAWNTQQFNALSWEYGSVLALFAPSHMQYEVDRESYKADEPSLSTMTEKAIERLSQNEDGFFLMVESGRIDHGHHAGNAHRALTEGQEFARAIKIAAEKTNAEDTLIVVTADHSHVMTMGGYPTRGNPILGLVVANDKLSGEKKTMPERATDGKPYTTLTYANGRGYHHVLKAQDRYKGKPTSGRYLSRDEQTLGKDFHQEAVVPLMSETHGGEDVAIYARGPWSHLFHGVHEQNYIYHVMNHALWPR